MWAQELWESCLWCYSLAIDNVAQNKLFFLSQESGAPFVPQCLEKVVIEKSAVVPTSSQSSNGDRRPAKATWTHSIIFVCCLLLLAIRFLQFFSWWLTRGCPQFPTTWTPVMCPLVSVKPTKKKKVIIFLKRIGERERERPQIWESNCYLSFWDVLITYSWSYTVVSGKPSSIFVDSQSVYCVYMPCFVYSLLYCRIPKLVLQPNYCDQCYHEYRCANSSVIYKTYYSLCNMLAECCSLTFASLCPSKASHGMTLPLIKWMILLKSKSK